MPKTTLDSTIKSLDSELAREELHEKIWRVHWALSQMVREALEEAKEGDAKKVAELQTAYTRAGELVVATIQEILDNEETDDEEKQLQIKALIEILNLQERAGATLSKPNLNRVLTIRQSAQELLNAAGYEDSEEEGKDDKSTTMADENKSQSTETEPTPAELMQRLAEVEKEQKELRALLAKSAVEEEAVGDDDAEDDEEDPDAEDPEEEGDDEEDDKDKSVDDDDVPLVSLSFDD